MSERSDGYGDRPAGDWAEGDPRRRGAGKRPQAGMPRWVKIFGAVGLLLVVLMVVALMSGHGPGRHMGGHGGAAASVAGVGVLRW